MEGMREMNGGGGGGGGGELSRWTLTSCQLQTDRQTHGEVGD